MGQEIWEKWLVDAASNLSPPEALMSTTIGTAIFGIELPEEEGTEILNTGTDEMEDSGSGSATTSSDEGSTQPVKQARRETHSKMPKAPSERERKTKPMQCQPCLDLIPRIVALEETVRKVQNSFEKKLDTLFEKAGKSSTQMWEQQGQSLKQILKKKTGTPRVTAGDQDQELSCPPTIQLEISQE